MIYSLTGEINRIDENLIVVSVGGVGYEVCCSLETIDELTKGNSVKTVLTYLHVREDAMMLFGFAHLAEKRMFLNLISVTGIGPKMAISILSGMSSKMLASAVANNNVSLLTKIKGLGKKTAERMVLELKEKVAFNIKNPNIIDGFEDNFTILDMSFSQAMSDAVQILTELGIKKEEATKLVKAKAAEGDTADQIIRKCL